MQGVLQHQATHRLHKRQTAVFRYAGQATRKDAARRQYRKDWW